MKKGLIFVLFALVSIVSYSQISWNAKVGMNMSNFTGDMDTDMRIGFNVGVGMEYQFSDMWSIQPSLMFTQKGAKQDEVKMNPMYLEIPVLAAARFAIADNQNIVVKAGPYFAYGIAGSCIGAALSALLAPPHRGCSSSGSGGGVPCCFGGACRA